MVILFLTQAIGMATIIGKSFIKMEGVQILLPRSRFVHPNVMLAMHEPVPGFRICALKKGIPSGML